MFWGKTHSQIVILSFYKFCLKNDLIGKNWNHGFGSENVSNVILLSAASVFLCPDWATCGLGGSIVFVGTLGVKVEIWVLRPVREMICDFWWPKEEERRGTKKWK